MFKLFVLLFLTILEMLMQPFLFLEEKRLILLLERLFLLDEFLFESGLAARQPFLMRFLPGLAKCGVFGLIFLSEFRLAFGQAFFEARFFFFDRLFPEGTLLDQLLALPVQFILAAGNIVFELRF